MPQLVAPVLPAWFPPRDPALERAALGPFQPPAWLRGVVLFCAMAASYGAMSAQLAGARPERPFSGMGVGMLLCGGLLIYLLWLLRRSQVLVGDLDVAQGHARRRDFAAAEQVLRGVVRRARVHHAHLASEALLELAALRLSCGRPTEALWVLEPWLPLIDQDPRALVLLAEAEALLGNLTDAEAHLREVPDDHPGALAPRALVLLRRGEHAQVDVLLAGAEDLRLRVLRAFAARGQGGSLGLARAAELRGLLPPEAPLRYAPWPELCDFARSLV